jgi:hypothetical protein
MRPPLPHEYPNSRYFAEYLNFKPNENLFDVLEKNQHHLLHLFQHLTLEEWDFAYEAEKWTRKQVLGHIIDTERIFSYRALAISRGEKQSLPGFDENTYLTEAQFESQSADAIITQYSATRSASISLFQSFTPKQWDTLGHSNDQAVSVRALAWMIAGHEIHHLKVLKEKYRTLS